MSNNVEESTSIEWVKWFITERRQTMPRFIPTTWQFMIESLQSIHFQLLSFQSVYYFMWHTDMVGARGRGGYIYKSSHVKSSYILKRYSGHNFQYSET